MIGLLKAALLPSGFATMLTIAGLATLLFSRAPRLAFRLLAAAALILLVFSNGVVATLLLSPLEYSYPALRDPREYPDAKSIVVLTAYGADDSRMPLSSRMNGSSAFRVLEAANLWSQRSDCRVIVSGSATAARIMARQLLILGVPSESLSMDVMSNDTSESAERVKALIGKTPVFLVTSAGHMDRAVGVFRRNGIAAIPSPTDYRLPKNAREASWTSSPIHLQASDLAVHEYIGLAWYRLTERI